MPRDKYHPYMVEFPLARRMAATGHTAASVHAFLQPYDADVQTVARWAKTGRVPFPVKSVIEKGLNHLAPPPPRWVVFDLRKERSAKRLTRAELASFLDVSAATLENWEERNEVPGDRIDGIKKLLAKLLPKARVRS